MTDLCVDERGEVAHAPFDPAGPGTIKWLHHRLMKVHEHVEPTAGRIGDSLAGRAGRVKDNGLGFDQTRLGSQADDTAIRVDPVVEVLAFFGLALLPVRGLGGDRRLDRFANVRERQRGWRSDLGESRSDDASTGRLGVSRSTTAASTRSSTPGTPRSGTAWTRVGVHAGWRAVPFQRSRPPRTRTQAFGAERL